MEGHPPAARQGARRCRLYPTSTWHLLWSTCPTTHSLLAHALLVPGPFSVWAWAQRRPGKALRWRRSQCVACHTRPLTTGCPRLHSHLAQVRAAFLKAIGFIIPLMDAMYANYYTREVMIILIR